jgi:hypothetical protein
MAKKLKKYPVTGILNTGFGGPRQWKSAPLFVALKNPILQEGRGNCEEYKGKVYSLVCNADVFCGKWYRMFLGQIPE